MKTVNRPPGWCSKKDRASTRACARKRRDATVQATKSWGAAVTRAAYAARVL
jgi:hypothetical protein